MLFKNRFSAGNLLAQKILASPNLKLQVPLKSNYHQIVVLAIPRGGIPVAIPVAKALKTSVEVIISRKIGAPLQPELAIGAICEDAQPLWNEKILSELNLNPSDVNDITKKTKDRIQKYTNLFRNGKKLTPIANKIVILIDDGIATGASILAAISYLRKNNANKIILATPVASTNTLNHLRSLVDDIVCLHEATYFSSVGEWYEDFTQVESSEALELMK